MGEVADIVNSGIAVIHLLAIAGRLGIPARETWSGAGHDAQHLTALVPCLLTFVPLHGGESHTPQEGAAIDEILQAGQVVAAVLGRVDA